MSKVRTIEADFLKNLQKMSIKSKYAHKRTLLSANTLAAFYCHYPTPFYTAVNKYNIQYSVSIREK